MTTIRFTQLYDFVVGVLYELKIAGETGFFSLRKLLKDVLEYPATPEDIFQIGKYLEARGYVKILSRLGDTQVEITPAGIINWEQNLSAVGDSFTHKVNKDTIKQISKKVYSSDILVDTLDARREIFEVIQKIISATSEIKKQNPDIHLDAHILELEFKKLKPDLETIFSKFRSIEQIPSISRELHYLREAINF